MKKSRAQARVFSDVARRMTFELAEGPSPAPLTSPPGPYDQRLGYSLLHEFSRRLQTRGFQILCQARPSHAMQTLSGWGLFPAYPEKTRAGLKLLDQHGQEIYSRLYPYRLFPSFADIPPSIVEMLLFIENRELLNPETPLLNPAVEWDRLGRAFLDQFMQVFDPERSVPGGSTLATQMEKFRHSEQGITHSMFEKFEQMLSASVRAYLNGEETLERRQRIVLDYINSVPLAARPDYGEINGLGDGLWAWYGADFDQVVNMFREEGLDCTPDKCRERALALKQVLSLFVAHKRPTDYLMKSPKALEKQCAAHLRLLANNGLISRELLQEALAAPLVMRSGPLPAPPMTLIEKKATNAVRTRLLTLLGLGKMYDLDRLDLEVQSTLDLPTQVGITREIMKLQDPQWVAEHGLNGFRLLETGDVSKVIYSFTLYEKTPSGNVLRVQTDNYDQPLNINEGVKLDLGSTAKLRALITYLEIIASLHASLSGMSPEELRKLEPAPQDHLTRWAISYLLEVRDRSLRAMLRAAIEREYSASPYEAFYTGGGLHTFENFDPVDNSKVLSVREGLKDSVNLVFIRLMRDVVRHYMCNLDSVSGKILDPKSPQRKEYLTRFADFEGSKFVTTFYRKYRNKPPEQVVAKLLQSVRPVPQRLVTAYRSVVRDEDYQTFVKFLKENVPESALSEKINESLFRKYSPDNFKLSDRGYLARIHPLELWVAAYLCQHPGAKLNEVLQQSAEVRQEAYRWLFSPSKAGAQNRRIKILLEIEAFVKIHQEWKKLGYPFDNLVPSYATAIGSSGDRPAALTELMGIILNDGIHVPSYRIENLHFAVGTPYEAWFVRQPAVGERVLPQEITDLLKEALYSVVENGTAIRANRCFVRPDGSVIRIGGKTGTGDHRYEKFGSYGQLISSKVMNRSSVFSFFIGDRFFGTLTAYVPGPEAADYGFTSSLPVAILKLLKPQLMSLLDVTEQRSESVREAAASGPG